MSKRCNRRTGECDNGCKEGWKPPLCMEGTVLYENTYNMYLSFYLLNVIQFLLIQSMKRLHLCVTHVQYI